MLNINRAILFLLLFYFSRQAIAIAIAEEFTFKQAIAPRTLVFPKDHASHSGFQTEWWYVTGNVQDSSGHEFGYQFTIFRRAIDPRNATERGRTSAWAVSDLFVGHLAISDIASKQFISKEEAKRGVLSLAGATDSESVITNPSPPLSVWLGNWKMLRTENGWTLKAEYGEIGLDLILVETLKPIAHGRPGEEGLSHKGPRPGQASYYYSVPQLSTSGTLSLNGITYRISKGHSWMDHEFGSNQLSPDQAGWDWFSIQFNDGRALMLYILRNKDGSIEPRSSGTWIDKNGKSIFLPLDEIKIKGGRTWTSPFSNGRYTLEWHIELPKLGIALDIAAAQDDQEVKAAKMTQISYYEGAIHVNGQAGGEAVSGDGYLEITGAPGQKGASGRGLGGMF